MNFDQRVVANEVLTVLKDAAQRKKFGEYEVDPNSIKLIDSSYTVTPSTTSTPSATSTPGRVSLCLFS